MNAQEWTVDRAAVVARPRWLTGPFVALALRTYGGHLALLVAGLVAAFCRFWHLTALGYNSDEAVYAGQGASIADDPDLKPYFPIFRAHPLLYQSFLSIGFHLHIGEVFGRLASAGTGIAAIVVVYYLANLLYGRRAAAWSAFFLAVMPYHVLVSRQVLLDGPMTLLATVTLYFVARWAVTGRPTWLYAAGGSMGLTLLAKETSILLLGAIYAFVALSPEIRFRFREVAISLGVMVLVVLPFPVSLMVAGRSDTGQNFLVWQLFRRPNHSWGFYLQEVPRAIGPAIVVLAVVGLWFLRRESSWRERLLVTWIAVPTAFFQLWPVKGFQYLLPIAPAVAILAARTIAWLPEALPWRRLTMQLALGAIGFVALVWNAVPTWSAISSTSADTFLAGTGGVPGGREAGRWIDKNVPEGAVLLAIGPSMANIVQFYGHRKTYGLSVSPNPLHRNPSYEPVPNPDLLMRQNELQYLVWDSFSADRTPFFSRKLIRYADRYHGRTVHVETVPVTTAKGKRVRKPIIIIFEVRP
jgi:hypothetical protein